MAKSPFLTNSELRKITGETIPKKQIEVLTRYGLNPIANQNTGVPIIYREVVMAAMGLKPDGEKNGTEINLEHFKDGKKKPQRATSVLRTTTQRKDSV
jgi:hypothetical protein